MLARFIFLLVFYVKRNALARRRSMAEMLRVKPNRMYKAPGCFAI